MKYLLEYKVFINKLNNGTLNDNFSINEGFEDKAYPEIAKHVEFAKLTIMKHLTFLGKLLRTVPIYEEPNKQICDTFFTTGTCIVYNPQFVERTLKNNQKQIIFVIIHELLHIVYNHVYVANKLKISKNDHHLFNVAADYAINPLIIKVDKNEKVLSKSGYEVNGSIVDKNGSIISDFPGELLYDVQFRGLDVETIYNRLKTDKRLKNLIPTGDNRNTGSHPKPNTVPDYNKTKNKSKPPKKEKPNKQVEQKEKKEEIVLSDELKEFFDIYTDLNEKLNSSIYHLTISNNDIWIYYKFEQLVLRLNKIIRLIQEVINTFDKTTKDIYRNHYNTILADLIKYKNVFKNFPKNVIDLIELNKIKNAIDVIKNNQSDILDIIRDRFDVSDDTEEKTEIILGLLNKLLSKIELIPLVSQYERNTRGDIIIDNGQKIKDLLVIFDDLENRYSNLSDEERNPLILLSLKQLRKIIEEIDDQIIKLGNHLLRESLKTNIIFEELEKILNMFKGDNDKDEDDQSGGDSGEDQDGDSNQSKQNSDSGDYENNAAGEEGEDEDGNEGDEDEKEQKSNKDKEDGNTGKAKELQNKIEEELKKALGKKNKKDKNSDGEDGEDENGTGAGGDEEDENGEDSYGDEDDNEDGYGDEDDNEDGYGDEDGDGDDDVDLQNIETKIKRIVKEGMKSGTGIAELDRIIEFLSKEDLVDWKAALKEFLDTMSRGDDRRSFPKRRYIDMGMYLSDFKKGEDGIETLYILIDTSGSVNPKQLQDFSSEINKISKIIDIYKIVVLDFDTDINEIREFYSTNDLKLEKLKGGGGTDIPMAFKWIENNYEKHGYPSAVLMFTDGLDTFPDRFMFAEKTLFIISKYDIKGTFGRTIKIE